MPFDERPEDWWPEQPEPAPNHTTHFQRMVVAWMTWPLTVVAANMTAAAEGYKVLQKATAEVWRE